MTRRLLPLLLVIAAVLWQFAPVLSGRVYRFEDIAGYFEPLWTAAARAMRAGRWPLWDGGAWSGQPIVGDPQAGVFYPPNWLWLALPVLRAYAATAALHALWAGLGMYVLVRVRGGSRAAAALGGVALGVGGYVVLQVRHIMFVEATAWMPWVVAAGWRASEPGRARLLAVAGLALATGMLLATGGVSMIYYGFWFAAAVLLPRALSGPAAVQHKLRCIAALTAGGAVGLLLSAPSWWTAAAHGALSPRALGADEHFAASVAWSGFKYLPTLFVPNLLGQQVRGDYVGGGTQWEIAGYYTGMATFALGLFAIGAGRRERRGERLALAAVMALAVLLAPGEHSPLHGLACRLLPLYSTMRCPPRALYVVALAMPLLAADGLDLVLARLEGRRPLLHRSMAAALPLLVAVDLLVTHRAENPTMTLAEAHRAAFPEAVEFLRSNLRPGERYVNDVHLRHDLHGSGLLWGLPNASGYSSLPLWRYLHLLWISNHGRLYPHAKLHDDLAAQGLWKFDSPVLDLLGVRYVLAPRGWDPKARGYVKRFEGKDGAGGVEGAGAGATEGALDVWENVDAMPRAWLVFPTKGAPREAETAELSRAGFDGWTQLLVEEPGGRVVDVGSGMREPGLVTLGMRLSEGEGELAVEVRPSRDAWLVTSQPYHPDWRASVDGKPAVVEVADYALTRVAVPAGEHRVKLWMTAPAVEAGVRAAGMGALCVAAMGLAGVVRAVRERRRRREREADG